MQVIRKTLKPVSIGLAFFVLMICFVMMILVEFQFRYGLIV